MCEMHLLYWLSFSKPLLKSLPAFALVRGVKKKETAAIRAEIGKQTWGLDLGGSNFYDSLSKVSKKALDMKLFDRESHR